MEEIISLASREIQKANAPEALAAGVVLTGGGALLPGTVELAEQILDMPVKTGMPGGIDDLPEDMKSPEFATAVGLVIFGYQNLPNDIGKTRGLKGIIKKIEGWISRNF
jgi:cell division protein FtsA